MKYKIEAGKEIFELILEKKLENFWEVKLKDKKYLVNFIPSHILINENSLEYEASYDEEGLPSSILIGEKKEIPVNIHTLGTQIKRRRNINLGFKNIDGNILAPMNGQVVKILTKEKTKVKEGEILLVLEAMKMENEIYAPKSGIIKSIKIKEGQIISRGDILLEIE